MGDQPIDLNQPGGPTALDMAEQGLGTPTDSARDFAAAALGAGNPTLDGERAYHEIQQGLHKEAQDRNAAVRAQQGGPRAPESLQGEPDQQQQQAGPQDDTQDVTQEEFYIPLEIDGEEKQYGYNEIRDAVRKSAEVDRLVGNEQARIQVLESVLQELSNASPHYAQSAQVYQQMQQWLAQNSNTVEAPDLRMLKEEGGADKYTEARERYERHQQSITKARELMVEQDKVAQTRHEQMRAAGYKALVPVFNRVWPEAMSNDPKIQAEVSQFLQGFGLTAQDVVDFQEPRLIGMFGAAFNANRKAAQLRIAATKIVRKAPPQFVRGKGKTTNNGKQPQGQQQLIDQVRRSSFVGGQQHMVTGGRALLSAIDGGPQES